jgi:hypothetical protein
MIFFLTKCGVPPFQFCFFYFIILFFYFVYFIYFFFLMTNLVFFSFDAHNPPPFLGCRLHKCFADFIPSCGGGSSVVQKSNER